jgi:Flp pilus assembly protein TadG
MTIRTIRQSAAGDEGGALVELAVVLPVLILILVSAIDFSRVFYTSIALTNAARAGAQFGSFNSAASGNFAGMQTAATAATNLPGVTAVATRTCACSTDGGTFSSTTTPNDCTSPEATACASGTHRVITVTVSVSKAFSMIIGNLPGVANTITLTRAATLRVAN